MSDSMCPSCAVEGGCNGYCKGKLPDTVSLGPDYWSWWHGRSDFKGQEQFVREHMGSEKKAVKFMADREKRKVGRRFRWLVQP